MDTLDGTTWDVLIVGTGLQHSLLALALSRSGKKILHTDRREYYGGDEAALSLSEVETWASQHSDDTTSTTFSHASVTRLEDEDSSKTLSFSRSYSLSLAPTLLYTRSSLLPALVSSKVHSQLEFQAVGSWFIHDGAKLLRVPSGREDVFADQSISLREKRSLMKFLRFVGSYESQPETWQDCREGSFSSFLQDKFGLPSSAHGPLLALTLSPNPPNITTVDFALPRIYRHLTSIGLFGPGFGAVLPKWGGLAEIAQVACRACAVGGGVYVLGKGVENVSPKESGKSNIASVKLDGGETVTTDWVAVSDEDLPLSMGHSGTEILVSKSISIVTSPLTTLFPATAESGPTPAGAVVVIPSSGNLPPVNIFVHSSDTGECPTGQCVLYASIALPQGEGYQLLDSAVKALLDSLRDGGSPRVLWTLRYQQKYNKAGARAAANPAEDAKTIRLDSSSFDLALPDGVLSRVKEAWQRILGPEADGFMAFDDRNADDEEDAYV